MKEADLNRAKDKAESWTEKFLMWRIGLPTPWTFTFESVLWVFAIFGAFKLLKMFS